MKRLSRGKYLSPDMVQEIGMRVAVAISCAGSWRADRLLEAAVGRECLEVGMIRGRPVFNRDDYSYQDFREWLRGKVRKRKPTELQILNFMLKLALDENRKQKWAKRDAEIEEKFKLKKEMRDYYAEYTK